MTRTTQKELEGLVNRLNRITGNIESPYTKDDEGKFKSNVGTYCLDFAYGGVKLVQIVTDGGGQRNVTLGYETKANCYRQIAAYIAGIEDCIRGEESLKQAVKSITA